MSISDDSENVLNGLFSICISPFGPDNTLDMASFETIMAHKFDHGVRTFIPGGNTSEFYSLSLIEWEETLRYVVDTYQGKARIIPGVGHDLDTAVKMAVTAEKLGCDGIMVHQPSHPFMSSKGFHHYLETIASSIGIGLFPYIRSANIDDDTVIKIAESDYVSGIKYANPDLPRFAALVSRTDQCQWICGLAEMWAPFFFTAGATAFTSGLTNVHPTLSIKMLEALVANKDTEVREIWNLVRPFEALRAETKNAKNVSVVKEALAQMDLGPRAVRPPLDILDSTDQEKVKTILQSWNLL
ncbi:MAG: dihydrodipicolinate synthase family protein [Lentisphaeria bacterium]|nr:dihydrodipicolinate synthase family protein [Lentisphaeria bacterium]NQZ66538.1 dihydrodipicolinate synthase family protein [Lentisphaeria bacterium]